MSEQVQTTPEAPKPITVTDQPKATPEGAKVEPVKTTVQSAQAMIAEAAKKLQPANTDTVKPGNEQPKTDQGLTDAQIAAAEAKTKEQEAVKAAVIEAQPDFAAQVKKAQELMAAGDHLKAIEALGLDLGKAVKQATGGKEAVKAEETELTKAQAEIKRLTDQIQAEQARNNAERQRAQVVDAIIADQAYPNIKAKGQVDAALAEATKQHAALVAELGRPLNASEADKLVHYYLRKHNNAATEQEHGTEDKQRPSTSKAPAPTMKAGTVQPAPAKKRSMNEIKAEILSRAK